jgi:class 3 adenylate cyclase
MSKRMTPYRRLAGDSGVTAYHCAPEAITVRFVDGRSYTYTWAVTGRAEVEQMKQLAGEGRGLSTYISQHVRDNYATRD